MEFIWVEAPASAVGVGSMRLSSESAIELEDGVAVFFSEEFEEVPPKEFEDEPVGGFVGGSGLFVSGALGCDVARAEAAVGQPGGEFGGVVGADHAVAGVEVVLEKV